MTYLKLTYLKSKILLIFVEKFKYNWQKLENTDKAFWNCINMEFQTG